MRPVSSTAEKALSILHCLLERRRRRPCRYYTVSSKAEKALSILHCPLEGGEGINDAYPAHFIQ